MMMEIKKDFFGSSQKMSKILESLEELIESSQSVCFSGEEGVGRKSMATYIHQNSSRKNGPLYFIDCADESKEILNNLFGYREEKTQKFVRGALELANEGSIVLVDVDFLSEDLQKKIFKTIGELTDYDINIRFFSTSTKNLSKLVGIGKFHRGLFSYVSDKSITLPNLRERLEDVEFITHSFLKNASEKKSQLIQIDSHAMEMLKNHYWPENIQELLETLEMATQKAIEEEGIILPQYLFMDRKSDFSDLVDEDGETIKLMSLKDAEKLLIKKALMHTSENRTQAAKILGVSIRTLRNKINEYRGLGSNYFMNLR